VALQVTADFNVHMKRSDICYHQINPRRHAWR